MTDTTPTTDAAAQGGFPQDRIRQSLLKRAGLSDAQIKEALEEERLGELQLEQVLVQKGFMQERPCLELFGDLLGLDYVPAMADPYADDGRMITGPKGARAIGDPNMAGRKKIDPSLATKWLKRFDPRLIKCLLDKDNVIAHK